MGRVRLPGRETLKVARNWGERRSKEGADARRGGGGRGQVQTLGGVGEVGVAGHSGQGQRPSPSWP